MYWRIKAYRQIVQHHIICPHRYSSFSSFHGQPIIIWWTKKPKALAFDTGIRYNIHNTNADHFYYDKKYCQHYSGRLIHHSGVLPLMEICDICSIHPLLLHVITILFLSEFSAYLDDDGVSIKGCHMINYKKEGEEEQTWNEGHQLRVVSEDEKWKGERIRGCGNRLMGTENRQEQKREEGE